MRDTENRNLVVALDIGTAKIMAVVAECPPSGEWRLLGMGHADSAGMNWGVLVDAVACEQGIQQAIREAERMAGCKITRVAAGISGQHISYSNSHGMAEIGAAREITQAHVDHALRVARAGVVSTVQRQLLEDVQGYFVDQQPVSNPLGMSAQRLDVDVHFIFGSETLAENLTRCLRRCGLELQSGRLWLNALASGRAVLTPDERELGVLLLDMGEGTTDFALFTQGFARRTGSIALAGENITRDIARLVHVSLQTAENLKINHGCASSQLADPDRQLEVADPVNRGRISHSTLSEFMEPRIREILEKVRHEALHPRHAGLEPHTPAAAWQQEQYADLTRQIAGGGVVLTGGSADIVGMPELIAEVFQVDMVRIGKPRDAGPLSDLLAQPRAATVMGLLQEARLDHLQSLHLESTGRLPPPWKQHARALWRKGREVIRRHF